MRRKVTAVIMALFVFSLIAASAASLNGISTAELGADSTVVASCDADGVDVDYNWNYINGDPGLFDVVSVDVSGIDSACNGFDLYVELGDQSVSLGSGSVNAIDTSSQPVTVAITPTGTEVDAEDVTEIGIVISN